MKKIVVILFVMTLIWGVAGTVSANVITETQWCPYCDRMDFVDEEVWLPPVYIGEFTFNYQHDVSQQLEPDEEITDAWLNLLFTDDLFDGWCDYPEELWYSFDQGANWSYYGDVDFMWYTLKVDPLLVKNGILDVSLSFGKDDTNRYLKQDGFLYASKFCGNTENLPAPEPSTLLLLGGGLLGLAVYGRRRMKK